VLPRYQPNLTETVNFLGGSSIMANTRLRDNEAVSEFLDKIKKLKDGLTGLRLSGALTDCTPDDLYEYEDVISAVQSKYESMFSEQANGSDTNEIDNIVDLTEGWELVKLLKGLHFGIASRESLLSITDDSKR
jgi:hypothetical protein